MKLQFLVIDDNRDASSRISRTLVERFPQAELKEFSSFGAAREVLLALPLEIPHVIVIAGRVADSETVALVQAVRRCHRSVPLIALGEVRDFSEAIQAGANRFLDFESSVLLPPTIERLMGGKPVTPRAR